MQPSSILFIVRFLRWLAVVLALTGSLGRSAEVLDELTREVAQYELTLPKLEAYGAAMSDLAVWAKANPAKSAAMTKRTPKGPSTLKQTIAYLESEPVIAEQLKKHQLTGRDFALIPSVLLQAQIAALGETQGRTFPADRINPKNTALVHTNEKRVGEIMTKLDADRARLVGQ